MTHIRLSFRIVGRLDQGLQLKDHLPFILVFYLRILDLLLGDNVTQLMIPLSAAIALNHLFLVNKSASCHITEPVNVTLGATVTRHVIGVVKHAPENQL